MQRKRQHKKSAPGRVAETIISEIGAKGDGVAIVAGAPAYVPYTAPGDRALIEAHGDRGRLIELKDGGPDRAAPPCAYYGSCGGCALQHIRADYYRQWKERQIRAALEAAGIFDAAVAPIMAIDPASRRRARFYVERNGDSIAMGFYARRSRKLVDLETCLVLHPVLTGQMPALRHFASLAPGAWRRFSMAVTLCENGLDVNFIHGAAAPDLTPGEIVSLTQAMKAAGVVRVALDGEPVAMSAAPVIRFDGVPVSPPCGSFLQASEAGQAALIELVRNGVKGARKIADIFSGCGTFALPLAKQATVTAFDSDAPAIAALKSAAGAMQGGGLHPVRAEVRNLFERPLESAELDRFDAAVIDPPRAGAVHQARALAGSSIPLIVSVSCNPKTFARDGKILMDGGYQLTQVTPVDQFAYAPHIELVGLFKRV